MTAEDRAKYLVEQLGKEGALRQCYEEIGNANSVDEIDYYQKVAEAIISL